MDEYRSVADFVDRHRADYAPAKFIIDYGVMREQARICAE